MAEQLLAPDHRLLCLSRQVNAGLGKDQAAALSCTLTQWPCDLGPSPTDAATALGRPAWHAGAGRFGECNADQGQRRCHSRALRR